MLVVRSLIVFFTAFQLLELVAASTDEHLHDEFPDTSHTDAPPHRNIKDRLSMESIKSLTFYRNRMTTARRTHSIHQLSCVGGTAGCKLFTPDFVECEKTSYDRTKVKHTWKCRADISDRVVFKHVEVICEGYDYPEDDYILAGSCGLEFTLDYVDQADFHEKSYLNHMDDDEKQMHIKSMKAKKETKLESGFLAQLLALQSETIYQIGLFVLSVAILSLLVSYLKNRRSISAKKLLMPSTYGPLTVLNTKKAC